MKARLAKFWNWIKRKKYYVLSFFVILFIVWYNCLPNTLFSDPTSTIVYDYKGKLLGARIADDGQWRFPASDQVPYKFKQAIIQFEDRSFYSHIGFSFKGLGRAIVQNIKNGDVVSGGSTITMQVIRMSRKKPRTYWQKIVEIFMSTRLEARYTKDEILALYASNAPMGGNVVGLEAAAWRYFGRSSQELSWSEASLLAVLPNAPGLIHLGKNRDKLKNKRNRLLARLLEVKEIDSITYSLAIEEELPINPKPLPQEVPHLMDWVITSGNKGKAINTTIHHQIQTQTFSVLNAHHNRLKQNNIFNGAVIVGDLETGEVLSYVGNTAVKEKEHGGDVDIIRSERSSGSILKPFLYALMIEDGLINPHQLVPDVPTTLSGYSPVNYNKQYAGAIAASKALSRSLNIPFVVMLRRYGVERFKDKLKQLGMTTLDKSANHYGLSLILGGAEVKLLDLLNMYSNLAASVKKDTDVPMFSFLTIDSTKKRSTINGAASWFTIDAMLDVERPQGERSWETFSSSRKIAWKTGTSYGFRDAWAVGFDSKYIVGVWIGNADGEGRPGVIGVEAAAPVLFDVFDGLPPANFFSKPLDEIKQELICKESGYRASDNCVKPIKKEVSIVNETSALCPYHHTLYLDKTLTYQVNSNCYDVNLMKDTSWFVLPPKMEMYYQKRNPTYTSPPKFLTECSTEFNQALFVLLYPKNESKIIIPVGIGGQKEKPIFEANHANKNASIFWHLDDHYLGKTKDIHQIEAKLNEGKHLLRLVDDFGVSQEINFEVIKE